MSLFDQGGNRRSEQDDDHTNETEELEYDEKSEQVFVFRWYHRAGLRHCRGRLVRSKSITIHSAFDFKYDEKSLLRE